MYIATYYQKDKHLVMLTPEPYEDLINLSKGAFFDVFLGFVSFPLKEEITLKNKDLQWQFNFDIPDGKDKSPEDFSQYVSQKYNIQFARRYHISTNPTTENRDYLLDEIQELISSGKDVWNHAVYYPFPLIVEAHCLFYNGMDIKKSQTESIFDYLMRLFISCPRIASLNSEKVLAYIPVSTTVNYYRNVRQFYNKMLIRSFDSNTVSLIKQMSEIENYQDLTITALGRTLQVSNMEAFNVKKILQYIPEFS